ncbi:MAG TPA: non-canonical purine NTP pyrophosphatase, RdgB/HAM1 family [Acidimicrobiaceae bacterium]|jgi:XTP/dITP diphosphohydrolase|nr:non-canonical purine NTP pyrophosphatase, RdgB/HAM1 family [Acidimicrobiaceae bacterium]|tara:strand:+ start:1214 stop:1789 length:576 start_codon:yes stop_codon:yes gene_type:complete
MDLVCASANSHKYSEMAQILSGVVNLIPRPPEIPDVVEDANTLEGNARLKATAIQSSTGCPAVADDTGLEVDALGGAPGIFSARYAGENATYEENVSKLLEEMSQVTGEGRSARFRTVALIVWEDGAETIAEGVVEGVIAETPSGKGGFGYDSVFIPSSGEGKTFAEMSDEEKNDISHRGVAFRKLKELLL